MTDFFHLTYNQVRDMSAATAERYLLSAIANRATLSGGGKILRWSEYNENPDPLINRLLAKLLVDKMQTTWFEGLEWDEIVVIAIENSAAYLAVEISFEVMRAFALDRPLRIVRARKTNVREQVSPAMSAHQAVAEVKPITADGAVRFLVASMPKEHDIEGIKLVIVADDFRATGNTLRGGVEIAETLFSPERIIPVAAMGKSWQETEGIATGDKRVEKPLTALDVRYWWEEKIDKALISVNNLEPLPLTNVIQSDFDL